MSSDESADNINILASSQEKIMILPVPPPPRFHEEPVAIELLMSYLGLTADQFRIINKDGPREEDGDPIIQGDEDEHTSKFAGIDHKRRILKHWFERENNVILIYRNATPNVILGDRDGAHSVAQAIGINNQKIVSARRELKILEEKRLEIWRTAVEAFITELKKSSEWMNLPVNLRAKIGSLIHEREKLADKYHNIISEISTHWGRDASQTKDTEHLESEIKEKIMPSVNTSEKISSIFEEDAGGNIRCECKEVVRMSLTQWHQYRAGKIVNLACTYCRRSGSIRITTE
ncbi:MAG: hypothetical protein HZA95_01115 [Candidatus Vogelbacteria bacterium]|nr:hypothetical protein [Candidatus Vogelbacteria bacterium]